MADSQRSFFRRRRLQFSLLSVFVLMTVCAALTWYWFQWPYAVKSRVADSFATSPALGSQTWGREEKYVRRLWGGGTRKQGPRRVYDSTGTLRIVENYRNGQKSGEAIKYYASGAKEGVESYVSGKRQGPWRRWSEKGELIFEGFYDRGLPHGRFEYRYGDEEPGAVAFYEHGVPSGKWSWFPAVSGGAADSDGKARQATITGQWRDGSPDGRWEWRDVEGGLYIAADYKAGRPTFAETGGLNPRMLAGLVEEARKTPTILLKAFEVGDLEIREQSLMDFVMHAHEALKFPLFVNLRRIEATGISVDSITFQEKQAPFVVALCNMLAPLGLGCDYRYAALEIDTLESIAHWRDETGVLELSPPRGSRLEREWNRITAIDMVEMPLKDVLAYLQQLHSIPIQLDLTSRPGHRDPITPDVPVTKTLSGISLKNVLGIMLSDLECKVSVQGNGLVIEPQ